MVLSKIKNLITGVETSELKKYQIILDNLSLDMENLEHHSDINLIKKAFDIGYTAHKGQLRKSGEEYFNHCIEVATQLSEWNMDRDVVIAGLLHDTLEDTDITKDDLVEHFNEEISKLVEGVSKLSDIKFNSRKQKQAENFMKMFLTVAQDIRVIIIKFSDRLHNLRTINHLSLIKQRRVAEESRDIFVPLAHRLGMNNIKTEMADIILKTLEPKVYKDLKKKVSASKKKRESYINKFIEPLNKSLLDSNINANVYGRAKNYSSIYYKMQNREKDFDEIFDLFAIRIIVEKMDECYAALGVIHQTYKPFPDRFKDYIATPKQNGYQSIHTTVIGSSGNMVEIQIRTKEMDKTAEVGIAAHWTYKEDDSNSNKKKDIDRHVKWLRELIENIQSEDKNPQEFLKLLKINLFQDEIFVFTPEGDLVQLKTKSTPIDFAFEVHTQVGMHCIGAKVNFKQVPLNTELKSGDKVEIITSKKQTPSHAWLKFVQSPKAKSHIKRWVNKIDNDKSISLGKEVLEKTLRRLKQLKVLDNIEENPTLMGFNNPDLIFSEVAKGHITARDLIEKYSPNLEESPLEKDETLTQKFIQKARGYTKGVKVGGISNTLISFAKCCNPIPGDEIVGYITRGKGVTVHRNECHNIPVLKNEDRFIDVDWNIQGDSSFMVRLSITATDRKHLLKDISEKVSLMNIYIQSIDMKAHEGFATCILIIQIRDTRQLDRLFRKLKQLSNIVSISRR